MNLSTSLGHLGCLVVTIFPGMVLAIARDIIPDSAWEICQGPFPPGSLSKWKAF